MREIRTFILFFFLIITNIDYDQSLLFGEARSVSLKKKSANKRLMSPITWNSEVRVISACHSQSSAWRANINLFLR